MSWSWLIVVWGLLRDIFTGPRPKSRIRLEVKGEDVIAQERKHLEELNAEIRRIERELDALAPQATAAIKNADYHTLLDINDIRKRLFADLDTARRRKDDFERCCSQGR